MARQPGLFDVDERLRRLSDIGDQLEAFAAVVDFEMFRPDLVAALNYSDGSRGGRPPFDPVMMFKILVIQAQNDLSDDRAEFLINDRLSFMRFLGLGLGDRVPDAKTIWAFRERLTRAGAIEALFARFDRAIREAGHIPMSGQIVDASLVSAPKQRNSEAKKEAEKKAVKAGRVPEEWQAKPAKLRQKDRDARWTLVFGKARLREDGTRHADIAIPVFGYKSHASIDRRHGFIRKWDVTDASTTAGCCGAGCSTRPTPAPPSGPTAPTAHRRTRHSWSGTASAVRSTTASRRPGRCRPTSAAATPAARASAPPSSMSSPTRRARWPSASARSASPAPG
jgi:transposase, IS5 family